MQSSDDCFHFTTSYSASGEGSWSSSSNLRLPRARHKEHQDGIGIGFDIRSWPRTLFVSRPLAPRPIDLDEMALPDVVAWQPLNVRKLHDRSRLANRGNALLMSGSRSQSVEWRITPMWIVSGWPSTNCAKKK